MGTSPYQYKTSSIDDSEIIGIIFEFEQNLIEYGKEEFLPKLHETPVVVIPLYSEIIGFCDGKAVVLSQERWGELTHKERKFLIVHELGHCVLDRNHTSNKNSIMFSPDLVVDEDVDWLVTDDLWKELMTGN